MPRPREVENASGSVVGLLLGAVLGGPAGAFWGTLAGTAANPRTPVPLDRSVAQLFQTYGLEFSSLVRLAKNRVQAMFSMPGGGYWFIVAEVTPEMNWSPDALDDALYDAVHAELGRWLETHVRRNA